MRARFGVRRSEATAGRGVLRGACGELLLASALLSACSGDALVVGHERPRPGGDDGEPGGTGAPGGPEPPDVALLEDCPPSPAERRALLGCWPTPHLGTWRGYFIGVPLYETRDGAAAEFPLGDVLLRLGVDGAGDLTFGVSPSAPSAAVSGAASCEAPAAAPGCEQPGRLLAGFAYRLEQVFLHDPELEPSARIAGEPPIERPERMEFQLRVGEPWNAWCVERAPDEPASCSAGECAKGQWPATPSPERGGAGVECRCDGEGCRPDAPSLFMRLSLSDDGKWLRGASAPVGQSPAGARFELRKELE